MKYINNYYGQSKIFNRCKLPMMLQIFADGDGAGAGGEGGGTGDDGSAENDKPKSFDEILGDKEYQKEFDRRMQKAIDTAVKNAQENWQVLTDDRVSEAEKLAKMNKDEQAEYRRQKHEKELANREAAITKRELMAEAKITLADKDLPVELADILNYADADTCSKSIAALEKAFNKAVETKVQDRLKGSDPITKAKEQTITAAEYQKMGYAERLKLKTENPDLFKQLSGN